ncbi:MAG: DUF423 domain-containing protein [Sinobacteraceae bacterium]|nr:DUF423 domain-containing protein [Nevskia sp.]MDI3260103.1 DUF423 domain-containing protein [Nevskiaceae bacterium]
MNAARAFLALGAAAGLLGVALGAFGAHALRARFDAQSLAVYHTAVQYQFYHAAALLAVGLWAALRPTPAVNFAGACFALGILLFCGSLYVLVLSGARWLGVVTPIGGVLFLLGWGALLYAAAAFKR